MLVEFFRLRFGSLFVMMLVCATAAFSQSPQEYTLSAGDRILVRVVAWSEAERQFETLSVVSGEYKIQPGGRVPMPLVGTMSFEGLTLLEASELTSSRLHARLGQVDPPATAIEILDYRPLFVVGDVARPGSYPATPGLTAMQAFALAGGSRTSRDFQTTTNSRETLRDQGALSQTLSEILRFKARAVRFDAEVKGQVDFEYPEGLSHPNGTVELASVLKAERDIFQTRLSAFNAEINSLDDLKVLLRGEVASLQTKLAGQVDQSIIARETRDRISGLVDQGLARSVQLNEAQRALFQTESQELDLQNNVYRAEQRIREADRDIISLQSRRATEATTQLQIAKAELERLEIRRSTLSRVLIDGGEAIEFEGAPKQKLIFAVLGADSISGDEKTVAANYHLKPGDILTVTFELE